MRRKTPGGVGWGGGKKKEKSEFFELFSRRRRKNKPVFEKKLKKTFNQQLTHDTVGVLAVAHAPERVVLGSQVRAHRLRQLVLGRLGVGRVVAHQRAGAAEAEEAVDDEHRAVLADVPVFVVFWDLEGEEGDGGARQC